MASNLMIPSQVDEDIWIIARRHHGRPAKSVGKWLIYREKGGIDDTWEKIVQLLHNGDLWSEVKVVADGRRQENAPFVIYVYTADANDEEDVMRIRRALREYGITEVIRYKTDEASWRKLDEYLYSA